MKVAWFDGEAPATLRLVLVPEETDLTSTVSKLAVFDEDLLPDGSVVVYLRVGEPLPSMLGAAAREGAA